MTTATKPRPATTRARILIVDDHPLVREGLSARISRQADLEVCGEAADVESALERVRSTNPDLVIVDISLKSGNGIELIKQIKASGSKAKMLVATMHDELQYGERALRAGATGYINKQEVPEKILDAIREVLGGRLFMSRQLTDRIVNVATGKAPGHSRIDQLSDRELEVFRMIGQGQTTRRIAGALRLSVRTIESHRENIKAKLGAANGAQLAHLAITWVLENG